MTHRSSSFRLSKAKVKLAKEPNYFPGPDPETGDYLPIPRLGSVIPFGYRLDPEDDKKLLPIKLELDLLREAKKYLKTYSSRAVAAWLSEHSGRTISHVGLLQRLKVERKRSAQAKVYKGLAKRYAEALKKIDELNNQRTGSTRTSESEADADGLGEV